LRALLFLAPNLFEDYYIFDLAARWVWPGWGVKTARRLAVALLALYLPKLAQEYVLHVLELTPWVRSSTADWAGSGTAAGMRTAPSSPARRPSA
jgi:hypothetical protein